MRLAWWSDMASLIFAFFAYWVLLSKKGTAFIATKAWTLPLISIVTFALIVFHLARSHLG